MAVSRPLDATPGPKRAAAFLATERVAVALTLTGLLLFSAAVRFAFADSVATPWIMLDELLYSELARSFADSGQLLVRGAPTNYTTIYPVLIAPAWKAGSVSDAYELAKGINVALVTAAALPFYLWARRLLRPSRALAATAIVLVVPGLLYTGMLMTENAFFPAFLLAAFAIAAAVERPTLGRQGLALAAIGLAAAVRLQGVVLVAVLLTAIAIDIVFDIRAHAHPRAWHVRALARVYRWLPTLAALLALAHLYVLYKAVAGASLMSGLGGYEAVTQADYAAGDLVRWLAYHGGGLVLSVGLVPASALAVLLVLGFRRGVADGAERAFLAVTASAVFWLLLQVSLFASRFSLRVEERNLFVLAPLLVLALAVWIERGLPRPRVATAAAVAGPLILLATLPLERLFGVAALSDTFSLIPLMRLNASLGGDVDQVKLVVVLVGAAVGLVFALAPRAVASRGLPAFVAVLFVLVTSEVSDEIENYSRSVEGNVGAGNPSWIDERVRPGQKGILLFSPGGDLERQARILWQTEFWNRRLAAVYHLGSAEPADFPERPVSIDPATGRVRGVEERNALVVVDQGLRLDGVRAGGHGSFVAYRVSGLPKIADFAEGIHADGWMGTEARYYVYGERPRRAEVTVSRLAWGGPDVPGRVRIEAGPLVRTSEGIRIGRVVERARWTVHSGQERTFRLAALAPPYVVRVRVAPTFSPSDFGEPDERELGAQVRFQLVQPR